MKNKVLFIILCGLACNGFAIVPGYSGARSLSLGYASTAFNYDINAIFINPSLLASASAALSGYQYQNSFLDYKDFNERLNGVMAYNLTNFTGLSSGDKADVLAKLKDLYQSKAGMYGFISNMPGFISKGYGLAVGLVNTTVINPATTTGGVSLFDKAVGDVTNEDIAGLRMKFLGLKYKQISVSYGMELMRSVNLGVTVHYLNGKVNDFGRSIADDVFRGDKTVKDYLEYGWSNGESKFSKVVADVGVSVNLGRFFCVGMVVRNFGSAKIKAPQRDIALPRRMIAGLAFRPNPQWGFYLDMDVKESDLLYNGQKMQPISFGIEKSFFDNKLFIRAGMLNDITEKHIFGKKSNALYGLGLGFNMGKMVVDLAVGLNSGGTVKNLAISGFFIVK